MQRFGWMLQDHLTPTPKDSKRRPSRMWQQPLCTRETPSLRRYPKRKQTAVLWDCVANARKTGPRWDPYPRLSIWEPHLRCCSTRRFWETLRELRSLTTSIDFGTSFDAFVPRTEIWVPQLKSSSMSHVAGEVFWSPISSLTLIGSIGHPMAWSFHPHLLVPNMHPHSLKATYNL